jgi:hypothetical protein
MVNKTICCDFDFLKEAKTWVAKGRPVTVTGAQLEDVNKVQQASPV